MTLLRDYHAAIGKIIIKYLGHYKGETAGAAAFRKALTLLMGSGARRN